MYKNAISIILKVGLKRIGNADLICIKETMKKNNKYKIHKNIVTLVKN